MPKIIKKDVVEESKELVIAKVEVPSLISRAIGIDVESEEDKEIATDILSQLNTWNDRVVADRETLTVPLNALLKNIRARYSPVEKMLAGAIEDVRGRLGRYQTDMMNKSRAEEAKIAARVGEGRGKLGFETASKKMEAIEKPVAKVEVDSGTLRFREDKVLKVLDKGLIPIEYYDLNHSRVLADLKAGKEVAGCVVELVQVPINNRR
jgi:hypothetical protein